MDPPDYYRPGGPVHDAGEFACVEPGGRVLSVSFYPAGSWLSFERGTDVRYVRVGLPTAGSY